MGLKHDLGVKKHDSSRKVGRGRALETPWRAQPELLAQDQRQVQGRVVNQEPFQNILPSSKVNLSHTASLQPVSERSFQHHATMPQQLLAAFSTDAPAIGVDGSLFVGLVLPSTAIDKLQTTNTNRLTIDPPTTISSLNPSF